MTIYTVDNIGVFIGITQHDQLAPLPRCSLTPPPDIVGTEVACLVGSQWVVLPEYPSPTANVQDYEFALENLLDTKARERTWKDCMSARAAAGSPSSFQPEGIAFVNWWDACWELAHTILAEVQAGTRPMPTVEEFLGEMPDLVLPI